MFTKSIAEGILNENARDMPFCIFRFPVGNVIHNLWTVDTYHLCSKGQNYKLFERYKIKKL